MAAFRRSIFCYCTEPKPEIKEMFYNLTTIYNIDSKRQFYTRTFESVFRKKLVRFYLPNEHNFKLLYQMYKFFYEKRT